MSLVLQSPEGQGLADALEAASAGATNGGGVFAFATRRGVERLFAIPNIRRLLANRGRFDLVVGTDAITNADALLSIEEHCRRYPTLNALAFLHDLPTTFHPKYSWFCKPEAFCFVIGSGNLTSSGIGEDLGPPRRIGNWEAFDSRQLHGRQAANTEATIRRWLADHRDARRLLPLTHEKVLERAVANSRIRYVNPHRRPRVARAVERVESPIEFADIESEAMIREIPSNRSGQADVSQGGLAFFGFAGAQKRVLIQHVGLDNHLDVPVERLLFVNASQNYRIEISEIAELPYEIADDDGRLILVAVKLDDSAYRYSVVPVNSRHYAALNAALGPIRAGRRLMRTAFLNASELKARWHDAPASLFPLAVLTVEDVD